MAPNIYIVSSLPGEWPLVLHMCCVVRSRRQESGQEAVQWLHGSRHSIIYGAVLCCPIAIGAPTRKQLKMQGAGGSSWNALELRPTPCTANSSCCPLRPHTTPFPEENPYYGYYMEFTLRRHECCGHTGGARALCNCPPRARWVPTVWPAAHGHCCALLDLYHTIPYHIIPYHGCPQAFRCCLIFFLGCFRA